MTAFSRRGFLAGAAGALTASVRRAAAAPASSSLAEAGDRAGVLFGASIAREALEDAAYGELYRRHARILTTDWALKFDTLRPTAEAWRFEAADRIVDFGQRNGMAVRGHALIWNENAPAWLASLSAREIGRVFDAHIERAVSRYAGRLHSWDVVNEPFWPDHGKPGGYRDGPWFAALGQGYVARALKRAALADPKARLAINEAHCEIPGGWGETIRPRLLDLVTRLKDDGAPLHAVGLQGHLKPRWGEDDDRFLRFVEQLAARGVEIYVTELDVDDSSLPADVEARDAIVARRYFDFLSAVLRAASVKVVQCWQLADRYSWLRAPDVQHLRGAAFPARPLPFDDGLNEKPAAEAIRRAFAARKRSW
ncbi:MAG: endo-1,4-beta-xylanase [Rhizobiales bacterium]|nr:endo-1,4-beta-xylanase [Hyphomicrobiales bacterium]